VFNLSVADLLDYTAWERQQRHEWMRRTGDHVLSVSAGANGNRFQTVGDLVKHMFSAEKRYVERLSGKPITDTNSISNSNLESLFQFGKQSRNDLREFLQTFPSEKWDIPQQMDLGVALVTITPRKSVTHILLHEIRHWAQIGTFWRMAGYQGDFYDFLFCPAMGGILRQERGPVLPR
jgi:uncharacterized damage-inducible protein DinB